MQIQYIACSMYFLCWMSQKQIRLADFEHHLNGLNGWWKRISSIAGSWDSHPVRSSGWSQGASDLHRTLGWQVGFHPGRVGEIPTSNTNGQFGDTHLVIWHALWRIKVTNECQWTWMIYIYPISNGDFLDMDDLYTPFQMVIFHSHVRGYLPTFAVPWHRQSWQWTIRLWMVGSGYLHCDAPKLTWRYVTYNLGYGS